MHNQPPLQCLEAPYWNEVWGLVLFDSSLFLSDSSQLPSGSFAYMIFIEDVRT